MESAVQNKKTRCVSLSEDRQAPRTQKQVSLAEMAISDYGIVLAYLVFHSCASEAFASDVSLSATRRSACERFCGLDYGADWFDPGISQGQAPVSPIAVSCRCSLCRCCCYDGMVVAEYKRRQTCRGVDADRPAKQPDGCGKRYFPGTRCVDL